MDINPTESEEKQAERIAAKIIAMVRGYREQIHNRIQQNETLKSRLASAEKAMEEIESLGTIESIKQTEIARDWLSESDPKTQCPRCGKWQEDQDGFGVISCECGYCKHPSYNGGKCDVCGESDTEPDTSFMDDYPKDTEQGECEECGGSGYFVPRVITTSHEPCEDCNGTGKAKG